MSTVCEHFFGKARIVVNDYGINSLIFNIKGSWINNGVSYHDRLKMTLSDQGILVEHLRFDENNPYQLVQLVLTSHNCLESLNPHSCGQDLYRAQMSWDDHEIRLLWVIRGPKKNEQIFHRFS